MGGEPVGVGGRRYPAGDGMEMEWDREVEGEGGRGIGR